MFVSCLVIWSLVVDSGRPTIACNSTFGKFWWQLQKRSLSFVKSHTPMSWSLRWMRRRKRIRLILLHVHVPKTHWCMKGSREWAVTWFNYLIMIWRCTCLQKVFCEILLFELILKSFLQDGWNTLVWIQNELWVAEPSLNADRGDSFYAYFPWPPNACTNEFVWVFHSCSCHCSFDSCKTCCGLNWPKTYLWYKPLYMPVILVGLHLSTPPRNPLQTTWLQAMVEKEFSHIKSSELVQAHHITSVGFYYSVLSILDVPSFVSEGLIIQNSTLQRETSETCSNKLSDKKANAMQQC